MTSEIVFTERAVAFIDILGFKSMVGEAEKESTKLEELVALVNTLENSLPELDMKVASHVDSKAIPEHLYISDCLIISAPLFSGNNNEYFGLASVVMRVIQVAHTLLEKGYLIRGGIDIGPLWHTKENVIGVAYQEAYKLETETSAPRIQLSDKAKKLWEEHKFFQDSKMCMLYRKVFMVNTLFADASGYMSSRFKSIEDGYQAYSEIINEKIKSTTAESARYKWWWLNEFKFNYMKDDQ